MNQHARLWVNYQDWSDCTIHALTLNGGRASAFAAGDVATVGISIHLPPSRILPKIGDHIDIGGWLPGAVVYAALFSGNVTDVAFEPGAGPDGGNVVSLTAADTMRVLDGLPIGDVPWIGEYWGQRIDRIWSLARTQLGNPQWMQSDIYDQYIGGASSGTVAPFVNATMTARDIDSQPALGLLREYFTPNGHALYYTPGSAFNSFTVAPPWAGETDYVNLFNLHDDPAGRVIPDSLILAVNPSPRYWMNLSNTAHKVVVRAFNYVDGSGAEFYATGGEPEIYGYQVKSIATQMETKNPVNAEAGPDDPQELANYWLPRVERPAYMCEITLRFGASTPVAQPVWDRIAHGGPAQCGRMAHIENLVGSTAVAASPSFYEWIIEGTEFVLTPAGWDVRLSLSPTSVYRGTVPIYPDTGNTWNDLIGEHASWDDLVAAHATWIDVTDTMHPHPDPAMV